MIPKQTILELVNSARIPTGAKRIITADVEAIPSEKVHIVTGCGGCPLSNEDWHCMHPDAIHSDTPFINCPLKTNSLTIQLAKI